jgi:threonine dehydrogenase-like Zn-dependent dehydrogenase
MKALTWHGRSDVRYESVPDPSIVDATDAIVRITSTAICGSDLHLYDGFNPFMLMMETDRAHVLREAILCCRPGGTISIPGVYFGVADKIPLGPFMNKGLTLRTGQTHMPKYLEPLLRRVEENSVDLSFIITHTAPLSRGPELYQTFRDKQDGCIKCVLKPEVN